MMLEVHIMDSYKIYSKAEHLIHQCNIRDAERIASDIGINIMYTNDLHKLLGMYTYILKNSFIILNASLAYNMKQIVIAHEIGHDQLHRDIAKNGMTMQEFNLFTVKDITEYEANAFAAHILLDNDDILSLAKEEYSLYTISKILNVPPSLAIIKVNEMQKLGYSINVPIQHDSKFLRYIGR